MPFISKKAMGTKMLTLFPENSSKNLPVIEGMMILNDRETGQVKAILDGKTITELRTGAVGGVGLRYTTGKNIKKIGLVGLGVQGLVQLRYALAVRNIEEINLYNRNTEKTEAFVRELKEYIGEDVSINLYKDERDVLINSEAIITATTSKNPVLTNDKELLRGKSFIGIGSYTPDMREYPDELFSVVDKIFVDTEYAKEESGDLKDPLDRGLIKEDKIEKFSSAMAKGDFSGETTLYKSVGMGLFDVIVAEMIYKKAREQSIGQDIEI